MYKLVALLYLFAAFAYCEHTLLFDKHTANAPGVAYFKYYGYTKTNDEYGKLRLAYLVPKLGHKWDNFKTVHNGLHKPVHDAVKVHDDELLFDLLGFTNCKTWYAVVLHVYDLVLGEKYRPYLYTKNKKGDYDAATLAGGVVALGDLVHTYYKTDVYKKFVESGVPAHPLGLYLKKYY